MAATITKEFLYDQMEKRTMPYWVVGDGREDIAENMEAADIDESKTILENVFANIMDSFVFVKLYARPKGKIAQGGNTRNLSVDYKIQLRSPGTIRGMGGFGGSNMVDQLMADNRDLMNKLHEKDLALFSEKMQKQIDDLKRDKDGKDDPVTAAVLQGLAGMFGAKNNVVTSGLADGEVDEKKVARQAKIRAALMRLYKVDPKFEDTITLLADFAEKNPEKYKTFIPLVKSMT